MAVDDALYGGAKLMLNDQSFLIGSGKGYRGVVVGRGRGYLRAGRSNGLDFELKERFQQARDASELTKQSGVNC